MSATHPLLARQLKKASRDSADGQPDVALLAELVGASYLEHERDRRLNERAAHLMEGELRAANARAQEHMRTLLDALIQGIKEGVIVTRANGGIVQANAAAEALTGVSALELAGAQIEDLFDASASVSASGSGVPSSGAAMGHIRARSGRLVPVEVVVSKMDQAGGAHILWIVRDISAQVRWARDLEENRKRTEDFARTSSDWFWQTDAATGAIDIFGAAPEGASAVLTTLLMGAGSAPGVTICTKELAKVRDAVAQRAPFRETQAEGPFGSGRRWVAISGVPVFDAAGEFKGYRGSVRDISDFKAREDDLRRAREAADEANTLKSHFLATMSHELRTPMNAILGFSEVIRDQLFGDAAGRYSDYAKSIHTSGQHLLALINDILDLSKIEAGNYTLNPALFCLSEVAGACATMVRPQAEKGGVTLTKSMPAGEVLVRADDRAVRQIVVNLLSNAVKFTPRGGSVSLELTQSGDAAVMIIRDTGIGISADFLPHVFSPFRQQDSGLSRKFEGTGLGLAITKRLVEAHGGTISIDSREGEGTTVTVRLPANAAGQAAA